MTSASTSQRRRPDRQRPRAPLLPLAGRTALVTLLLALLLALLAATTPAAPRPGTPMAPDQMADFIMAISGTPRIAAAWPEPGHHPAAPAPITATPTVSSPVMPVLAAVTPIGPVPGGAWRWPLPGQPEVTRGFDAPTTRYGPGHRGVDLATAPGVPVLAAGAGVVGWAGILAGRGVVSVRHAGGLRTTYEPVTPTVRVGQAVASGARLGVLVAGHPGCPRQACLHWGLLQGDEYLDPLRLLGFGPVRLLPLSGSAAPRAGVNGVGAAGPAPAASATPPAFHRPLMLPSTTAATAGVAVLLWMLTNRRRPP